MLKIFTTYLIITIASPFCSTADAQINPVKWSFTANKLSSNSYEVKLTATLNTAWHIYSQFTPAGGPQPTVIKFTKNPLVSLVGKAKEVGTLKQEYEQTFAVTVKYFESKVEFVQLIKVRPDISTKLKGTLTYMLCTNQKCLPPTDIPFVIDIK